ncbi:hypothetical protein H311_00147 [Anncaliia algerae PRA109]|nr:hypothetical protein H311_00147 [Anncaliia algerae PRA109]
MHATIITLYFSRIIATKYEGSVISEENPTLNDSYNHDTNNSSSTKVFEFINPSETNSASGYNAPYLSNNESTMFDLSVNECKKKFIEYYCSPKTKLKNFGDTNFTSGFNKCFNRNLSCINYNDCTKQLNNECLGIISKNEQNMTPFQTTFLIIIIAVIVFGILRVLCNYKDETAERMKIQRERDIERIAMAVRNGV